MKLDLAVDDEVDVAQHAEVEAGRGDDDVGGDAIAGFQDNARPGETLDLIGYDGDLAGLDALEEVAAGNFQAMRCRQGR